MIYKLFDTSKINAIPIREVASELGVTMKKKGIHYWAQCLWHQDRNASMIIGSNDGKHNVCHCFSCDCGNKSVIDLICQHENINWLDACRWVESNMSRYDDIYKEGSDISKEEWKKYLDARNEKRVNKPHNNHTRQVTPPLDLKESKPSMNIEAMTGDRYKSSFARCLSEVFGEEKMREVVDMYSLGAWKAHGRYDDVLFPSIDIKGNIRDLKIQAYDCDTRSEGFFHSDRFHTSWLGPQLYPDREFNRECLFGEQLLPFFPDKLVILVESPKNACVGFADYPQYLWLATGNKGMLKRNILEILRGRIIAVFPDEDAYKEWQGKIDTMRDIASFKLFHSPGNGEKRDIADWILDRKRKIKN